MGPVTFLSETMSVLAMTKVCGGSHCGMRTGLACSSGWKAMWSAWRGTPKIDAAWSIPPELTPTRRSDSMATSAISRREMSARAPNASSTTIDEQHVIAADDESDDSGGIVPSTSTSISAGRLDALSTAAGRWECRPFERRSCEQGRLRSMTSNGQGQGRPSSL